MIKLGDLVYEHIAKEREATRRPMTRVYPSSIGRCTREIVYKMLGYPQPPSDPKGLSIMENGNFFHARMEERFEKMGILVSPELPIVDLELNVSGRTDAVIFNPNVNDSKYDDIITLHDADKKVIWSGPNREVVLVELKSINQNGFKKVVSKGPKEGHAEQLWLYMYLTGIKQGLLLYENKNDQELYEVWLDYNEAEVKKIIEKINVVNKHVRIGTLPEREGSRTSYTCNYCDFKEVCWNDNIIIPSLDDII